MRFHVIACALISLPSHNQPVNPISFAFQLRIKRNRFSTHLLQMLLLPQWLCSLIQPAGRPLYSSNDTRELFQGLPTDTQHYQPCATQSGSPGPQLHPFTHWLQISCSSHQNGWNPHDWVTIIFLFVFDSSHSRNGNARLIKITSFSALFHTKTKSKRFAEQPVKAQDTRRTN